ncbi:MAG: CDP-glucose 4,6-dehydratase [Candidatus Cloacimonas sp.]|jgi:CDP-glucose 4,6-dehydratase|nr:CDP-glucose 4,6-dehydratase [Candidatus Cloacimonas sp.]
MFLDAYKNKHVLVTGNTGFKGSWLSLWLQKLNAEVYGYSLKSPTNPNHFDLLNLNMRTEYGDIRNYKKLASYITEIKPEVVFHLAAQSLVRKSYFNPRQTYETNVMGTLNLLEACKKIGSVNVFINVTSDKCYENTEQIWGYREIDRLGGYDPYSSSKACSEILTSSYRNSFLNTNKDNSNQRMLLASVRAGNVIGGGDWAQDRLIPDIMRAINKNKTVIIRNPNSIRPWQHVLEPLSGYLLLGSKLLKGETKLADCWNFGPLFNYDYTVKQVLDSIKILWDDLVYEVEKVENLHEASLLKLDCTKALTNLGWRPVWDFFTSIEVTTNWYKNYYQFGKLNSFDDLAKYISEAKNSNLEWAL